MPRCHVRLSAGRSDMSDELQALCFLAGANSIFYGEKLLTTGNPDTAHDQSLFRRLKISAEPLGGIPLGGTPLDGVPQGDSPRAGHAAAAASV